MDGEEKTVRPRRRGVRSARNAVFALTGIVLLGAGIGLQIWAASQPASVGWFAYAPLSEARFTPVSGMDASGWGGLLSAVGCVVLAFWTGLLIGERRDSAR